jgi:hypothetical protein
MMPWKLKQNLNCLGLGPLFKGLGTNLKLLTNMNAQFHWTLLLGSLSKVTLSFMPCWSPGHFCLLKSHPLYDQTRGSGVVLITSTPSFYINFRIDMTGFVDPNKMIARKSAFSALSSAWNESELKKKTPFKIKRPKNNLILSPFNHTFFILDPWIEPQVFRHTHPTLGKSVFLNMKKSPIQDSICFKLVPRLLVLWHLSKVTRSKFDAKLSLPCPFFYWTPSTNHCCCNVYCNYKCACNPESQYPISLLIKFHDFADNSQDGMKHQMRGATRPNGAWLALHKILHYFTIFLNTRSITYKL